MKIQTNSAIPGFAPAIFENNPRLLVGIVAALFLLAGAVRLYRLDAPGILPDREYTSAIFARSFYFDQADSIEAWRREIAHTIKQNQPVLEPPVTDYMVSLIYRAVGSEQLRLARLLTSSFWLTGGLFFFLTALELVGSDAAVFATAYYLFVPLGILASRSFQPDSLMMMLFLITIWSISRYSNAPSMPRLLTAAILAGLTLLIRPLVLFATLVAFASLALYRKGSLRQALDRDLLIFFIVSLLPSILYYGYGLFIAGHLQWKVDSSFRPYLLLHREFWKGWFLLAVGAVGASPLVGALLGIPILRQGKSRALVTGLWVGYVVFCLVFTFHIHTHEYYHLQLIPIVALSLGSLIALVFDRLRRLSNRWYWWLPVLCALILVLFFDFREIRARLDVQVFESVKTEMEIGEIVHHSRKTVYLAYNYGIPLQYYGELAGAYWPRKITYWLYRQPGERELTVRDRLDALGFIPEYFVITQLKEYSTNHLDLKEYLEKSCSLVSKSDQYMIYSSCSP